MAWTITINFANDALNAESRNAYATAYGYQDTINGAPNPESKAQFRERMIKEEIKRVIKGERTKTAYNAVVVTEVEN